MRDFLKELKRHIFIYWIFFKNSIIMQMEYRANFFIWICIETTNLFIKLLYAVIIYRTGVRFSGLPADSILLFIGTFLIMTGIDMSFLFFNFSKIQKYVLEGSLDMLMTKPVSLQFITTLRNIDLGSGIPNFAGGLAAVIIGWHKTNIAVNFTNIAGYIGLIISGTIIAYSILLAIKLLCFWIVNASSISEIASSIWDFNNMPMVIYDKWITRIGTFVFPIFLVSNFSPLFILGKLNQYYIIWGIAAPIIFFSAVRLFWKISIRNYSSASS